MSSELDVSGCFIYVICPFGRDHEPLRPVKVGITHDVPKRLASIQTGSHQRLAPVAVFDTPNREIARRIEKAIHKAYGECRLEGEWFNIDPIEAIDTICAGFRNHFKKIADAHRSNFDEAHAIISSGVPSMEFEARRLRSWREYYSSKSNVIPFKRMEANG